ncbi:response regulator [Nostocales cyanobacterium LEGE 11386]|nr:response regulator [Nostocales cyanobacterium LEGE 11386]
MPKEIIIELIKIIPSILWVIFLTILVLVLLKPIKNILIPQLSEIKAFGIEAKFIKEELAKAARKNPEVKETALNQVTRRAQRIASIIQGARLLLVNDIPEEMVNVQRILQSLGVIVDVARTTKSALNMLANTEYDVIISDMSRDGVPDEGLRFLHESIKRSLYRPTIFTVANFDPSQGVPAYAFGITNRVDEMLNLIFDVLERTKG